MSKTVLLEETPTDLDQAIGMLRQWINEERVLPKKMVTNEELHHWLDEAVQAKVDAAVAEARIDELELLKDNFDRVDAANYADERIKQLKNKEIENNE